uniref:Putative tail protein n=1 Tax=viral metagenome TaxID=1070528 RepID=A0A6M3KA36_9ZZZZ
MTDGKPDLEDFKRKLERWNRESPNKLRYYLGRAATEVVGHVQSQKLTGQVLKVDTGRLRRSVTSRVSLVGQGARAAVGTNVFYGRVHEFGATIVPKKAKALRFQVNGKWVTTQKVVIPKRPWLKPGIAEMLPKVVKVVGDGMLTELGKA